MSMKTTSIRSLVILTMCFGIWLPQVEAQGRTLTAAYSCHYLIYPSQTPATFRSGTFSFAPLQDDRTLLYGSTGLVGSPITISMEIQRARLHGPVQFFRLCRANFDVNSSDPYMGAQMGGDCSEGALYTFEQPITWDAYSDLSAGGPHRWAHCSVTVTAN